MQYVEGFNQKINTVTRLKTWLNVNKGVLYQVENILTGQSSIRQFVKVLRHYIEGVVIDEPSYYKSKIRSEEINSKNIKFTDIGFIINDIYEYRFIKSLDTETKKKLDAVQDICENNNQELRYSEKKLSKMYLKGQPINNVEFITLAKFLDIKIAPITLNWIKKNLYEVCIDKDEFHENICKYKYKGGDSKKFEEIAFKLLETIQENNKKLKEEKKNEKSKIKRIRARFR